MRLFIRDARGATAIEYAVIIGVVVLGLLGGLVLLGGSTGEKYQNVADQAEQHMRR